MHVFSLSKHAVGIDISDRTIELVCLKKSGSKFSLPQKKRMILEPGIVQNGMIQDQKRLSALLMEVFQEWKIDWTKTRIVFGLPENQSFVHTFLGDVKKDISVYAPLVQEELSSIVPIEKNDLVTSFSTTRRDKEKIFFTAVGASRIVLQQWYVFFESLGLKNVLLVPEAATTAIGLVLENDRFPVCVVDIGELKTSLTICDEQNLLFTYTFPKAGEYLTKLICDTSACPFEQAEREKQSGGLLHKEKEIATALKSGVLEISKEIQTFLTYAKKKDGRDVQKIILVGGTALLPGLVEFLTKELSAEGGSASGGKKEIEIGSTNFIADSEGLEYIEAVGLALLGHEVNKQSVPVFQKTGAKPVIKKLKKKTETATEDVEQKQDNKKLRNQLIMLVIITIIGIVTLGFSFYDQKIENQKKQAFLQSKQTNFSMVQPFDISVPIVVGNKESSSDRLDGRIFLDEFRSIAEKEEAIAFSKINASHQIKTGETVWAEPIEVTISESPQDKVLESEKIYTVRWLLYPEDEIQTFAKNRVETAIQNRGVKFAINNLEMLNMKETENLDVYLFTVRVSVALENQLNDVIIK